MSELVKAEIVGAEIINPKTEVAITEKPFLELQPKEMLAKAANVATEFDNMLKKQNLYMMLQGKKYIFANGWTTLAAIHHIGVKEEGIKELSPDCYESTVSLIDKKTGFVIGGASGYCGVDEQTWAKKTKQARRSMATTRASNKAIKLILGWIPAIAGYEQTTAEEMQELSKQEVVITNTNSKLMQQHQQQKKD